MATSKRLTLSIAVPEIGCLRITGVLAETLGGESDGTARQHDASDVVGRLGRMDDVQEVVSQAAILLAIHENEAV